MSLSRHGRVLHKSLSQQGRAKGAPEPEVAGGPASDGLLLETGDYALLETGDFLLLE